jgi:hypothetical protein
MGYPDKQKMCHRTGFAKSCRDLLDERVCQGRWVHITGSNMNTGDPIDVHGCVDDAQYLLQQSFEHRLVGIQAAVESRGDKLAGLQVAAIEEQKRQHREALSISSFIQEPPLPARNGGHLYDGQMDLPMIGVAGE